MVWFGIPQIRPDGRVCHAITLSRKLELFETVEHWPHSTTYQIKAHVDKHWSLTTVENVVQLNANASLNFVSGVVP